MCQDFIFNNVISESISVLPKKDTEGCKSPCVSASTCVCEKERQRESKNEWEKEKGFLRFSLIQKPFPKVFHKIVYNFAA